MKNSKSIYLNKVSLKNDWPLWLLILLSLLLGLYLKPHLSEQVPIHWNLRGQADGYASPTYAIWLGPSMTLALYLLMIILPYIDPQRANYAHFTAAYQKLKILLVIFLTGLQLTILAAGLGLHHVPLWFVRLGLPLLFIFFGNVMGQIRHNYFVGIRTPWTIANPEIWRQTHRLTAKVWVSFGLIGLGAAFLPLKLGFATLITALAVAALIPVLYSYLLFRRLG